MKSVTKFGAATLAVAVSFAALAAGAQATVVVSAQDAVNDIQSAIVAGHAHAPGCAHWGDLSPMEQLALRGELGAAGFYNASGATSSTGSIGLNGGMATGQEQVVFLDFVSATNSVTVNLDPTQTANGADSFTYDEFDYVGTEIAPGITAADAVQARMEQDYAGFNVRFTQERPEEGDFTTIFFNASDPITPETSGAGVGFQPNGRISGILFGVASTIDFRNQSLNDTAATDGNLWQLLANQDYLEIAGYPPNLFQLNTFGTTPSPENIIAVTINQTANTGSHELGHTLGLRHRDSLGPIGAGTTTGGNVAGPNALPGFTGPQDANLGTWTNVMASGASTGIPLPLLAVADRDFGQRSAIKLTFNDVGTSVNEGDLEVVGTVNGVVALPDLFGLGDTNEFVGDIRKIEMNRLNVPDTGPTASAFTAFTANIIGEITDPTQADIYQLRVAAKQTFSFELMGDIFNAFDPDRFGDIGAVFGQMAILDEFFNPIDYFGSPFGAVNICEMEGCGNPFIFDLVLGPGIYHIAIYVPEILLFLNGITDISGGYELFITAVPEPGMIGLFLLSLFGLVIGRRRMAGKI